MKRQNNSDLNEENIEALAESENDIENGNEVELESNIETEEETENTKTKTKTKKEKKSKNNKDKKKKMPLIVRILIAILIIVLIVFGAVLGTFLYLQHNGKQNLVVNKPETGYEETIQYNGHTYVYDKNKVAFAFLGVDKEQFGLSNDQVGTAGQSDADIVGVVDTSTGKVDIITIPRDTMVDIDLYNESGGFLRTEKMQLCLSYAYGDGNDKSCKNVTTAMSRILLNVPIEKYFALELGGIAPLNDAIGGVTVESLYDFKDEGIKKGDKITIKGDFAETYVRKRNMDNISASLNRTDRQIQYIRAYADQLLPAVKKDFSIISKLYNTAMEYSQTNISLEDVTYMASLIMSKGITSYTQHKIDGEMKASEKKNDFVFAEFYPDEDSILQTVIDCFYTEVE